MSAGIIVKFRNEYLRYTPQAGINQKTIYVGTVQVTRNLRHPNLVIFDSLPDLLNIFRVRTRLAMIDKYSLITLLREDYK